MMLIELTGKPSGRGLPLRALPSQLEWLAFESKD